MLVVVVGACAPVAEQPVEDPPSPPDAVGRWRIESPAGAASFAPALVEQEGTLLLSWLERTSSATGASGHRLRFARLDSTGWSQPVTIAAGEDFFANWADVPKLAVAGDGGMIAHWLAKTDEETYAYSVFLARSDDDGASWRPMGQLNDDSTPTEHGFVSWVADGEGARAFWLDGREMVGGGAMFLRTAVVSREVGASEVLDERVCECCATAAALTEQGPVVVFRDRSPDEIRDIASVRRLDLGWGPVTTVVDDGWRIEGCPVNGPAVASTGRTVAVVWYTAAGERPTVQVAMSHDAGATYSVPGVVDGGRPLGRADIVADGAGGFVLSWLEGTDADAEIRLRRLGTTGRLGQAVVVARTSPSRASGFPRLKRINDRCFVAWVELEGEDGSWVRVSEIPLSDLG